MNALDVLEQAFALFGESGIGWTRGTTARDITGWPVRGSSPQAVRFCSVGAIYRVTGHWEISNPFRQNALDILARAITARAVYAHGGVISFNDANEWGAVRDVWKKAIADARALYQPEPQPEVETVEEEKEEVYA